MRLPCKYGSIGSLYGMYIKVRCWTYTNISKQYNEYTINIIEDAAIVLLLAPRWRSWFHTCLCTTEVQQTMVIYIKCKKTATERGQYNKLISPPQEEAPAATARNTARRFKQLLCVINQQYLSIFCHFVTPEILLLGPDLPPLYLRKRKNILHTAHSVV